MVELIPCYGDRNLFLRLAKAYVEELSQYDHEIIWDEAYWRDVMWESVFIMEDRTIQGFITSEQRKFNVFPDALYIAEFYIVPDVRKRGLGKEAVAALLKNWVGDIYLYILQGNFGARVFWLAVEHDMDWVRVKRSEIHEESGCELRVYQQRR